MMNHSGKPGALLLRSAGVIAWLSTGAVPALSLLQDPSYLGPWRLLLWLGSFMIFGISFWKTSKAIEQQEKLPVIFVWLSVQSFAALLMFEMVCTGFESVLLVLVAAQIGLLAPVRLGLLWVGSQSIVLAWFCTNHWEFYGAFRWAFATLGLQLFAFLLAAMVCRESDAKKEISQANKKLRETQKLLEESSRATERLRISRELHDLLGHDLTALSLHLEVASHLSQKQKVSESVLQAKQITKRLLSDVREVVSVLREEKSIDVTHALTMSIPKISPPKIHLFTPEKLVLADIEKAQTIIRFVQESITNTLRHANAKNLWVTLSLTEKEIVIRSRDDGIGTSYLRYGNGLQGMQERFAKLKGALEIQSQEKQGFQIVGTLPISNKLS